MKKLLNKKNISQIIIGITISIIVLWFQPILLNIRNWIINIFIDINQSFSNYYYTLLSSRNQNLSSDYILYLVSQGILIFLVWFVFQMISSKREVLNSREKIFEKIEAIKNGESKTKQLDEILNDLEQLEKVMNKLPSKKGLIFIANSFITITVILLTFFIIQAFIYSSASSEISKFEHNLKVLSINIDENELKELEYNWATMKNKKDYQLINEEIKKYNEK